MTAFYNRDPWNLVVGFGCLAAVLFWLAVMISPWVVAGLFALIAVSVLKARLIRWRDLRRKGYFGGRQVKGAWVYEERHGAHVRSLTLKMGMTEPGHYELFLPSEPVWRTSVPAWAQDRQQEIVQRIAERLKSSDIHSGDAPRSGISKEEYLALMESEGWTLENLPDGTTRMTAPPRRAVISRLWRRIWQSD
jgi:hypothetical protein